jgi:hypothetical protein
MSTALGALCGDGGRPVGSANFSETDIFDPAMVGVVGWGVRFIL